MGKKRDFIDWNKPLFQNEVITINRMLDNAGKPLMYWYSVMEIKSGKSIEFIDIRKLKAFTELVDSKSNIDFLLLCHPEKIVPQIIEGAMENEINFDENGASELPGMVISLE